MINGLLLALVALGFHIIFSATKIFHIAHGGIYVAGVYFFLWTSPFVGVAFGIILSVAFAFLLGVLIEWSVYKPLLKKSSNENIALISSLGVYIIIINIIALLFGNETKILDNTIRESLTLGEIIITRPQVWQLIFALPLIALFLIFIKVTGYGLKIRAISDNPILARVMGIKTQNIRYIVFGLGSIMAVSAALLKGFDTGIDPYSGMAITLSAAVVVIIGGSSSLYGTILASMMLAIIQNFTEFFLSAQWKDTVTFTILIIVLLWRTEGILHFNVRVDEK
ncbi:MAG TPA: branched-chain amino acid ABC transporter permease [Bacteroidales bacterium]|nr:branched-chain amino acid ABC transporter permease [Bacteroidales bacterium]HSA42347.1 branched-chain amino acid ABC transporter permease [Bacteroidales bacterium]